jgi:hypothetical protein
MEQLLAYLKGLPDDESRAAFALRCGTSYGHLRNIGYDKTGFKCSPVLAALVEEESGGVVRRWDLRPHDWHRIWRELRKAKGAPEIAEAKAA